MRDYDSYTVADYLKFIIPSLIGIFLLMVPIPINGAMTLPVVIWSDWVEKNFSHMLPIFAAVLIAFAFIMSVLTRFVRPASIMKRPFFRGLFDIGPFMMGTRALATFFAVMTVFQLGPEWIWSDQTGGNMLNGLISTLVAMFLFAGFVLPLLLNFGLLEFIGMLTTKIMKPVFSIPGRSAIDCLASWLGDGTIGVLLTSNQYEDGFYTKREGAVIGTTFSLVSIDFTIVVLNEVGLDHLFLPYYLTILLAGLVAALIMPRIPPLSRKADTYVSTAKQENEENNAENLSLVKSGLLQAVERARNITQATPTIKSGWHNVLSMWLQVVPIIMAVGTIATILAEFTPLFSWLGAPFIPILEALQIPEAAAASQTMVVGFADMFLPAVLSDGIASEMTRFVIACISVTQLIYMSEVGGLLLGSKLPVNMKDLMIIFLERTLITLPVIALMAHLIF